MKIVIVGAGKVGFALAEQLTKEGHDIVLIDNDRQVIKQASNALDAMTIYGNGASLGTQRDADVENSDLLIAATPADEMNMICCIIARKLGCRNTIARVRRPEYAEQMYFLKEDLGLSMVINPDSAAAREIFKLMQVPGFIKRDTFAKGRVEIVELILESGGRQDGMSLQELGKSLTVNALVCAVQRGNDVYIPSGSFVMAGGDKIYVTAPAAEMGRLMHDLGINTHKARNAILIGGGRISQYLAAMLLHEGTNVKIIERNEARCMELAEILPKATIINADGSDQSVLQSENIDQMDAVVTLTNVDEENLLISLYADHLGVKQVITKINRTKYNELFKDRGLSCVVSPKQLCTQMIISYVRAMQNTAGSSVLTMYHLVDDKAEALEFEVKEATRFLGVPLRDIRLKPNILIASINRMGRVVIPGGSDSFKAGDTVVVVTTANRVILDLNDIFEEEP